jgi:nitrogen regulatory protein P-II 2
MKFVIPIVKLFELDEVRDALSPLGSDGRAVSETKGLGRAR